MADIKKLLEHRKTLKSRKPTFLRQEGNKKKKLTPKWRKPKGMHSKLRRKLRGHKRVVEAGWKSPAAVRGLSKRGLKQVAVATAAVLQGMDSKTEGAIISATVGMKARVELLKKANELGITVINFNSDAYLQKFEQMQKQKADKKAEESKKKEEKKKEKEKKAAEKEKEAKQEEGKEAEPDEDKKKEEKKELDRLLTRKDGA